jgi:hypothetical protein
MRVPDDDPDWKPHVPVPSIYGPTAHERWG